MKIKKILIINNDTGAMKDIKESINGHEYKIIHHKKLKADKIKDFTHIILTGGDHWVNLKKFSEEAKLIRSAPCPILGICYGHQLIGRLFNSKLKKFKEIIKGNVEIKILEKDGILKGVSKKLKVFEYRRYYLDNLGESLQVIAESKFGIESIKHKSLPIWGVQFHPEVVFEKENIGRKIIKNFLKLK